MTSIPSVVERTIHLLKGRWRHRTEGMLLYNPEKVRRIMMACGLLHNVANLRPYHCQSSISPHQTNQKLDPLMCIFSTM